MATYLRMAGWGTTTLISSGKDVYIHFATPEFRVCPGERRAEQGCGALCGTGGYYELDAEFTKPAVACVVGRWKSRLTRAVGHAGAMAGGADDASTKERWFIEKFGVDGVFTPEKPIVSAKGAVVTNIAHVPAALTAVMKENGARIDFDPEGSLALKPWFGANLSIKLPEELDLPVVEAIAPYDAQIATVNRQIGAVFPRQAMKDASGASQMDPNSQVTSLHGVSMLHAAQYPLEANVSLALLHEPGGENDRKLINVAIGAQVNLHGDPALAAAQAAREAGNAPNSVLAAATSIIGPRRQSAAREAMRQLIERFAEAGLQSAVDENFDLSKVGSATRALLLVDKADAKAEAMLVGLKARGAKSVFVRYLQTLGGHPSADSVLAAIAATLAWGPLARKRISRLTAESLPWWMRLFGTMIGASVEAKQHAPGSFCGIPTADVLGKRSLSEVACVALIGQEPKPADLFAFQTLVGLLLTNGPGAISAEAAKGATSADGPESPDRVQLNKALAGFLTHGGYAHGGNGYEGVAFLLERFKGVDLIDPGDPKHGLDLKKMATEFSRRYGEDRATRKQLGAESVQALPCINHPVFKGKPVNLDPREEFVRNLFRQRGEYNVFHDYYRTLVQALYDENVTRNVFCVNVDAVIATLLLKMLWQRYRDGTLAEQALETAAFTVFLYGRMLGCAAEIDDHLNRGRNMDTRTPQANVRFVA